jgi:glucan-binding YG repeat protein
MLTGLHKLDWSKGTNWFYFYKNYGNMLTGYQTIDDHGLKGTFYFDPTTGAMIQ